MTAAGHGQAIAAGAPDAATLGKVLAAAGPVLGRDHPVCQLLIQALADPDCVPAAWAAIDALPQAQRRVLAAAFGEIMMA